MSKGGVEEKARALKGFTKEERRLLMEGWVVGDLGKIIKQIKSETNGFKLSNLAEKGGLKVVEGTKHNKVFYQTGEWITNIGRHTSLPNKQLRNVRKALIEALDG